jgi:hypothetical protein
MEKLYILYLIICIVTTLATSTLAIWKLRKDEKKAKAAVSAAKTEQEKAEAEAKLEAARNAIEAETKRLVAGAEVAFEPIDKLLKAQHQTAGPMKKRDVETNLKAFCLENGFPWDAAAMDKVIEDVVKFTKVVNAKQ